MKSLILIAVLAAGLHAESVTEVLTKTYDKLIVKYECWSGDGYREDSKIRVLGFTLQTYTKCEEAKDEPINN